MNMQGPNHAIEIIREIILSRDPRRISPGNNSVRHAGVLMPLFIREGTVFVLFTRRTETVEHHKGQISFPGGAVDETDRSFQETALRETWEEIGLQEEYIDLFGPVDDTLTLVSNFLIHPFVGALRPGYAVTLNPEEVEELVEVPLSLFHPGNARMKSYTFEEDGQSFEAPGYEYEGNVIWGATARIMDNFMHILGDKIPLPLPQK